MRGTWETTGGIDLGQLARPLGGVAVVAVVVWLVVTFIWVIAAIVGVVLVLAAAALVWLRRHGGEVATVQRSGLPPPQARPLPSRRAQAPQAPQQHVHYHLHLDGGQAAELVRHQALDYRRDS